MRNLLLATAFILFFSLTLVQDSAAESERIRIVSGKSTYELGARSLKVGTVDIQQADSTLSEGEDFEVNLFKGTITLLRNFSPGTILLVSYEISGSPLLSYSLSEVLPVLPADSLAAADSAGEQAAGNNSKREKRRERSFLELPSSNLSITGEKALSMDIQAGKGAALSQSLDLSIGGSLTKGTDLSVYLSDNAMPVQAAGSSKEIRELDRISVNVTSTHGSATVGAYEFELDGYELARVRKNLEGFAGSVSRRGVSMGGAGAISGGEFTTNAFQGTEGKQGPYLLGDRSGRTGIVVIAGSENVHLDGRLLQKGTRGDYIINYNEGSVTFTDRNIITVYSRIEVEFEYASADYKRSFLATKGSVDVGDRAVVRGFMMRENDLDSDPLGGRFSESDLTLLASSDGIGEILLPGGRQVGEGEGEYILVDPGSESEHFDYVGPGKGDYQVGFTNVGQGKGDYILDTGTSHFLYVEKNNGDYIAARKVRPPSKRVTGGASFRMEEVGAFTLGGEGFFSSADRNTLSPGSGRQDAIALDIGGSLEEKGIQIGDRELGLYSLSVGERYLGRGFDMPARLYAADFRQRWGVDSNRGDSGENITTTGFGYQYPNFVNVSTELGFLDRSDGGRSRRRVLNIDLHAIPGTLVNLESETAEFTLSREEPVSSGGYLKLFTVGAERSFGRWLTSFKDKHESRVEPVALLTGEEGKRRSSQKAGLKGEIGKGLGLEISATNEFGELRESGLWKDWMKATEGDVLITYQANRSSNLNAHVTHRRTRFLMSGGETFNTTVGRLEYFSFPSSGRHRTQMSYELTSTSRVTNKIAFLPENYEDEGEYLADGTFVGKEEGTHRKEVLGESDIGEKTVRVTLSGVQSTDLKFLLPDESSLSGLTLTSTFNLVEENNATSDGGLFTFTSSNRFSEEHSVYSENNVREELEARWASRGLSLRLEYLLNRIMDNRYINLSSGNSLESTTLFLRSKTSGGIELGAELGRGNEGRKVQSGSDTVRFMKLAADAGYQVAENLRVSLEFKGETRNLTGGAGARLLAFTPGLTRFFRSRGRVHIEAEFTRATGRVDDYYTVLWLLKGKEFGLNSRLGVEGEYRIGSSLLFLARLSVRKTAGQDRMRTGGNTELRYIF